MLPVVDTDSLRVRVTRSESHPGVAVVELDSPGRSLNVVDEELIDQLAVAIDELEGSAGVGAAVLTSAKPGSFGAGADLDWLPVLAADPEAEEFLARTHELMRRIASSRVLFVAAVDGVALGGALELALACESIIATDGARLGLPESSLGLLPGGGGTQLLLRWIAPAAAVDLLISGRTLSAAEAADFGLVDEVVTPTALVSSGVLHAESLAHAGADRRTWRSIPEGEAKSAIEAGLSITRVTSPEAKRAILNVVSVSFKSGVSAGFAEERRQFLRLLQGAESIALRHMFALESASKKAPDRTGGVGGARHLEKVRALGLVGAGQMGAGIAATAVARGLHATIRDVDAVRLEEAKERASREIARSRSTAEIETAWHSTSGWDGFADVDAVIEAVFELPDLKKETLSKVGSLASETALIATNTSAIPISTLAPSVVRPERFLGMHFFSPVERMPLVELVPHVGTSVEAIDRATQLVRQLGKVPVTVADYPGFFTSRVYARWLLEALRLLRDGFSVQQIDAEAKAVGFAVGPLQAHDEATLPLVLQASLTQVADQVMTARLDLEGLRSFLEMLIAEGVQGRRFGRGFYLYDDNRRRGPNPQISRWAGSADAEPSTGAAGERLLLAFVTESLLCWDDATLCHPDDGDLASVLGIGFPRRLGGPFHWVDAHGPTKVLERCKALGDAFPAAETLRSLSVEGGAYGLLVRRERPGRA